MDFFARRRGVEGMTTTPPYFIVSGITILALSVCQPLMVTGVSPERHSMVNKVDLVMVVAHQVVSVILLKSATCWGICVLLCLS